MSESAIGECIGPAEADAEAIETALSLRLKALKINQALGSRPGNGYGNLANVYWSQGRLAQAEETYCKALALFEENGRYYQARKTRELLVGLQKVRQNTANALSVA